MDDGWIHYLDCEVISWVHPIVSFKYVSLVHVNYI